MKLLIATLVGCVLVVAAAAAVTVIHAHAVGCTSQNRDLAVLRDVLTVNLQGPHRFNTPADIQHRRQIYERQLVEIEEAKCG